MLEILPFAGGGAAGVALASALSVGVLRRYRVVGPLIEAETRRALWLRVLTLVVWLLAVALGAWYLNVFLASVHVWVGYVAGAVTAAALAALGIGVALL
jgi:hypothetical protein